jgi:hypothetical protein
MNILTKSEKNVLTYKDLSLKTREISNLIDDNGTVKNFV